MIVMPFFKRYWSACTLLLSAVSSCAMAQPLDDVTLEYQSDGIVATINMTTPVQYLRHFPAKNGKTLEIFYDRVQGATSDEPWVDNETRNSPPSGLIPSFTVTTRDQQTQPKLVVEFSREAEYSVEPGKDNRSLRITIRPDRVQASSAPLPFLPVIRPEAAAPAAALSADEVNLAENNKQARALMVQGRDALAAKNNEAAVDAFNKLLLLPPNDYTQDGQEWVGVARERAGQIEKAKTEYDLYLRLYTEGAGPARVMQRLAGLSGQKAVVVVAAEPEVKKKEARWLSFGSVTSRYYYGSSKIDSTYTYNNVPVTSSLSLTDQSMLITSVDASERYVSEDYDGRVVFRDVNTRNFLSKQPSLNRVNAAYGEIKNRKQDYLLRVGRQSALGGGVLGRFDGVYGSFGDPQELRVNGVAGTLADFSQGSKPIFFGAGYDFGPYSVYAINQSVDGTLDRRAIGTEWRYFEGKTSAYALVDYDTLFRTLNAAQMMGTVGVAGANLNFMVDHRKAPSLSIRNALNGAGTSSINALLQSMSASSLRDLALARTATANMGQIGVTVPFAEKWQIGGDVRVSNITGLPASGTDALQGILSAVPSRGTEKGVTGQVVGSSLYKVGDIWSASATFTSGTAVSSHSIFLYNHTQFNSGWAMDASLQLLSQTDQFGGVTKRTTPMVRGTYRIRDRLTFDVDGGVENGSFNGPQVQTNTSRYFYSAGLRLDF